MCSVAHHCGLAHGLPTPQDAVPSCDKCAACTLLGTDQAADLAKCEHLAVASGTVPGAAA